MPTLLRKLSINRVDLVDKGTNPGAYVMLYKRMVDLNRAVWTAAFINDLPDSSFAVISPGGEKDEDGKTKPRSLRHLPYKDASGKVDLPHLRNALARLNQTDISAELKAKARKKLEAAARSAGVGGYKKMFHGGAMTTDEIMDHDEAMRDWYKLRDAFMRSMEIITRARHDNEIDDEEHAEMMSQSVEEFSDAAKSLLGRMTGPKAKKLTKQLDALDEASENKDVKRIIEVTQSFEGDDKMSEEISKQLEEQSATIAKMQERFEAVEKSAKDAEAKAAQFEKRAKEAEDRAAQAELIAKAEAEKRELIELAKIAEDRWSHLPKTAMEKAEIVRGIRKSLPEAQAKAYEEMLDSAEQMARQSGVFREYGKSGDTSPASAWDEITKRARDMEKESKGSMTYAQAVTEVCKLDRDLYARYREEQN